MLPREEGSELNKAVETDRRLVCWEDRSGESCSWGHCSAGQHILFGMLKHVGSISGGGWQGDSKECH